MENQFGKVSRVIVCASSKNGKTILEDVSFTAPYKIMAPFQKESGGLQIMPLCASAGIMRGDTQEFFYHVKEGADLDVLSQSFEKIHKMNGGSASRSIQIKVDKHASLFYYPQPVIPFADSAFDSKMEIHLEDATARLFLLDILSCGRKACQERFLYRRFSSKTMIFRGEKLIYRDNTRYEPARMLMDGIGMFEGYTHMANIFLSVLSDEAKSIDFTDKIWEILEKEIDCDGGITRLAEGDFAVRIFGHRAQQLQNLAEKIRKLYVIS